MSESACDVAIIGGGPAGLAAATELKRLGVERVVVLERSDEAGGIPRHCGHPPFGMREFKRILTGPAYAQRLVAKAEAAGVSVLVRRSVVRIGPQGVLTVASPNGTVEMTASRILVATGAREATRAQLLVPGVRPLGIMNTAALQAFVYQERSLPFRRPVIIGSELVSLSALLTCRSHGIRPVAMVETHKVVQARPSFFVLPHLIGVPVFTGAEILTIEGGGRVTSVRLRQRDGAETFLDCDGVVFSGRFVAEAALAGASGLSLDRATGGPIIDQHGRSSDPCIFVAGNVVHPVETAGHCWAEGRRVAGAIAADLKATAGQVGDQRALRVTAGAGLKYVVPQRLAIEGAATAHGLNLRATGAARGKLVLSGADGDRLRTQSVRAAPQQPIRFSLAGLDLRSGTGDLLLTLEPAP